MKKVRVFNCRIRRKQSPQATRNGTYQLVREFVVGKDDVLLQGSFHTCRDAMDRYYYKLISEPEHYVVQWCDEFSFMVHHIADNSSAQDADLSALEEIDLPVKKTNSPI
ncbi:hypothetical protein FT643_04185 [Ketobacter sp. MCCC 1A13808]|uniref:hypothetical protein n=1 Tax=Ketobacter sp. MCCC 1A13808 TaxID=2602738 RepID=UPI000F1D19F7|nr:hypothetical protein [Ketobacter sp. MCCC 1A13808]MVF11337.1 hypothetical protein [Ketobacter sp. MCCC 1A13808]RLP54720.1 MAG: hypothetical protein D6160_09960 [Ketobacter sp.]